MSNITQTVSFTFKGRGVHLKFPEGLEISQAAVDLINTDFPGNNHSLENEGEKWINVGFGGKSYAHNTLHLQRASRTAFPFGIVKSTLSFIQYLRGEVKVEACMINKTIPKELYIRPKRTGVVNFNALLLSHILFDLHANQNKRNALMSANDLPIRYHGVRKKVDIWNHEVYTISGFMDREFSFYITALIVARDLIAQGKFNMENIKEIIKANIVSGDLYDGVWDMPELSDRRNSENQ